MRIEIQPLRLEDERSWFSSGDIELDRFFRNYAGLNQFRLHLAGASESGGGRPALRRRIPESLVEVLALDPEAEVLAAEYIRDGAVGKNERADALHIALATEIFEGVRDARTLTASRRDEYNTRRPHSSLGYQTPASSR